MQPAAPPKRRLSPRARRIVLTAHIVASVGLLGDVAALRAAATTIITAPAVPEIGEPGSQRAAVQRW